MKSLSSQEYTITLDDDPIVSQLIQKALGIKSIAFGDTAQFSASMNEYHPVAVFVDVHLPGNCGLDIIPEVKAKWPFCPVLVITGDPTDDVVSRALAAGADDFVRKPIRPKELAARLLTRLSDQAQKEAKSVLHVEDIVLDRSHRELRGPQGERYLSDTEINLLVALLEAHGTTVPRSTLKLRCWGQICVSDNALDRKIYEVRRALKEIGSQLSLGTIYGVGFSLGLGTETRSDWLVDKESESARKPATGKL